MISTLESVKYDSLLKPNLMKYVDTKVQPQYWFKYHLSIMT